MAITNSPPPPFFVSQNLQETCISSVVAGAGGEYQPLPQTSAYFRLAFKADFCASIYTETSAWPYRLHKNLT